MEPAIGMGATYTIGSDSYPYTIVGLKYFMTGKRKGEVRYVLVQADKVIATEATPYGGGYQYEHNPNVQIEECLRDTHGNWRMWNHSGFVTFGSREYYRDLDR